MGIKNLAFCEALVSYPGSMQEKRAKGVKKEWDATMEIVRWEKVDLVANTQDPRQAFPIVTSKGKAGRSKISSEEEDEEVDPYSLPVLSETAYRLIKRTILSSAPDVILIERQRWRSGGGSAVQQWTVRVNTLEGMLWAVLATLKGESAHLPNTHGETHPQAIKPYEVFAVDPKRVGQYWLQQDALVADATDNEPTARKSRARKVEQEMSIHADAEVTTEPPPPPKNLTRSKAEKKAKINMLRSWLASTSPSTTPTTGTTTPRITFKLGASAERIRQALCSPTKTVRRTRKRQTSDDAEGAETPDVLPQIELRKLDDVTDCFLQAAAWVSWEANRLQLRDVVEQQRRRREEDDAALGSVDDAVLLHMMSVISGQARD